VNGEFEAHRLQTTKRQEVALNFWLRRPIGQNSPFATVLYLHGAGDKGDDLELVRRHSLPRLVEDGLDFPFLLICPQCPAEAPGWPLDDLHLIVEHLRAEDMIDPRRLYLTGVSMGGRGAWEYAYWHASELAALVPVCGFGLPNLAPRLKNVPIWAWHGTDDEVLPVQRSDEMVEALHRASNSARYSRLIGVGHNCDHVAYGHADLWQWLAQQQRTTVTGVQNIEAA